MFYLYVITNLVNNKQYYGQTNIPSRRWCEHKCGHGSKLVYQAIQKYGIDNIKFEIICKGSEDSIKELEQIMIRYNSSKTPLGYNLTDGGEGETGWKHPEETRKRMSESRRGQGNGMYGKTQSTKTRKTISTKAKLRSGNGVFLKAMPGASNPRAIPVIVEGIKYGCIADAAKAIGCHPETLRRKFRHYKKLNNFPTNWGYPKEMRK